MPVTVNQLLSRDDPPLKKYLLATRPLFFTASALPFLLGSAFGYQLAGYFDGFAFVLALCTVICVHAGVNVLNDVYDDLGGTDRINSERIAPFTGGSRVIQDGILSLAQMRHWAYWLLGVSALLGAGLVLYKGYPALLYGMAGIVMGVIYSAPPFNLAARGIGEAAVATGFGVLIVTGAAWLQSGLWDNATLTLSLAAGLWVADILLINEVPDARADSATGKHTLAVRLGNKLTAVLYLLVQSAAFILLISTSVSSGLEHGALIVPAMLLFAALFATRTIPQRLAAGIKATLAIQIINCVWLSGWLLVS